MQAKKRAIRRAEKREEESQAKKKEKLKTVHCRIKQMETELKRSSTAHLITSRTNDQNALKQRLEEAKAAMKTAESLVDELVKTDHRVESQVMCLSSEIRSLREDKAKLLAAKHQLQGKKYKLNDQLEQSIVVSWKISLINL